MVDEPGLRIDVEAPSDLLADDLPIEVERRPAVADPQGNDFVVGDIYLIEAPQGSPGSLTIRMPISAGVDPEQQAIAYFDEALEAWVATETTLEDGWLSAESSHLSEWSIVDLPALIAWWICETLRSTGRTADMCRVGA